METQDTSMTNLIINYLPQSMTDKKLHQMFTQVGQIEACRVMKDVKVCSSRLRLFICVTASVSVWIKLADKVYNYDAVTVNVTGSSLMMFLFLWAPMIITEFVLFLLILYTLLKMNII